MDEPIIYPCPICGKPAKTIDKKQEAECDDLVKCDYNEAYVCYESKSNPELRFVARRSKPIRYFQDGK